MSASLTFLKDFTVASASSASAALVSTSRSSFTLSGFCAENSSDSRMNFNSMLCRLLIFDGRRCGGFGRSRFGRDGRDRLRCLADLDLGKRFRLRADELLEPDQFQQCQEGANDFRPAGGVGEQFGEPHTLPAGDDI